MRYLTIGMLLAAVTASAHGQTSTWGAFDDGETRGVGVQAAGGAQLILKCDKPGPGEVYAVVATQVGLVGPAQSFVMRPVEIQYDDKPPYDDRWRFYEHAAIAINKGTERSLTRLLLDLGEAQTLEVRLDPEPRKRAPITVRFDVAGAQAALAQVFESCRDTLPTS
jgi:hypothetical protein